MTSTYTTNKSLEKPANNDYVDTWQIPVNGDWDIIDRCFGGVTNINVVAVSGTVTLTSTQYQAPIIILTGLLTANVNYQLPSGIGGYWSVYNNTTGSFSVTISSAGGGSSVVVAQSYSTAVISDGTNIGRWDTNPATAGGSTTQVQFNSSGLLAGSASLTWSGSALTAPTFIGALTGNASTATSVSNALTVSDAGSGVVSGTTYNGAVARTISYNSVGAPSATGTNASGTWTIAITGNAATVTNGVYTTGSYADPAWITSLAGSKITGTISGNISGSAGRVANAVTFNNGGAGVASGTTFDGSVARTISYNTIGAASSGANTNITSLNPSGGLQVGAPTGGAQGTGTVNATGLYINGVAVGTGSGSVSSVAFSGGTTGLTVTGSPITTSGTITLAGTLAVANGGTGSTTTAAARSALSAAASGANTDITSLSPTGGLQVGSPSGGAQGSGTINTLGVYVNGVALTTGSGTVTSVALSGGSTGFSISNSPITTNGTMTISGTLAVTNGGTGGTTAAGARSSLGAAASGANTDITSLGSLSTPLTVAQGGTNASTAATARTSLGAAASGANSDITSLSALSTALSVAQGGTGATTASGARTSLGVAVSGANGDITSLTALTSLNQSATVAASGTIAANSIGFRGVPQNAQTGAYTLVLADASECIPNTTGGWAIPANGTTAFPVGTVIWLYNDSASSQNVTITSDTLRLAGTTSTGTRAVAARGLCILYKVKATEWLASGPGVS